MIYKAIITHVNFMPMVERVDSILRIDADLLELHYPVHLEERGSIKVLSKKFGFTVEGKDPDTVYDFKNFVGKRCQIQKINEEYKFLHFIE